MRGPGCDLEVRGWGIEGMLAALPAYAATAATFLNDDFQTRFGVQFDGWENVCDSSGADVRLLSDANDRHRHVSERHHLDDQPVHLQLRQPPTSRPTRASVGTGIATDSNLTPVQSNCEHFGLGDGVNGADAAGALHLRQGRRHRQDVQRLRRRLANLLAPEHPRSEQPSQDPRRAPRCATGGRCCFTRIEARRRRARPGAPAPHAQARPRAFAGVATRLRGNLRRGPWRRHPASRR